TAAGVVRSCEWLPARLAADGRLLFRDAAPSLLYTLSLHDALPIFPTLFGEGYESIKLLAEDNADDILQLTFFEHLKDKQWIVWRSEEHTSELHSREKLVCRLPLEKSNIVHLSPYRFWLTMPRVALR